jgi:SAM-dependent methyltransferase
MSNSYHERNRLAWNELVEVHLRHPEYRVKEFLEGQTTLKALERAELGDVRGRKLLHLMCQFGLDTLSWAREGAIVTGVDISDRSIAEANVLKAKANLQANFVRSDVLELRDQLQDRFDIVYQSYGTLCWLSDLKPWAEVVSHFLRPGGTFLLIDGHPIHDLFVEPGLSYFSRKPEYYRDIPDYCDRAYIRKSESVEWMHTISELLTSLISAGIEIEKFEEYDFGYYGETEKWYKENGKWYPPSGPSSHPLMMLVRGTKR